MTVSSGDAQLETACGALKRLAPEGSSATGMPKKNSMDAKSLWPMTSPFVVVLVTPDTSAGSTAATKRPLKKQSDSLGGL